MSEPYIINLLSEKTKLEIEGQIQHLKTMSEDDEYKKEFSAMLQGAKTILWLLENESIAQHGTVNFLKHLDRDQLDYAIEKAKELKKEKTNIGKIDIFGVFGGKSRSNWFHDYELAKQAYLKAAEESLSNPYPEISFEKRLVPIEELSSYLSDEDIEVAKGNLETIKEQKQKHD